MTTPAALVLALPAAPATSSSEEAASLAMVATSARSAISPEGMSRRLRELEVWKQFAHRRAMLALDFIKANRETVERAIRDKGVDLDLGQLLDLDAEVRGLKTEIDRLRAERNAVSAKFKDATPDEKAELGRQAKEAGARASELEQALSGQETELKTLMLKLPGIPYEGAPVG